MFFLKFSKRKHFECLVRTTVFRIYLFFQTCAFIYHKNESSVSRSCSPKLCQLWRSLLKNLKLSCKEVGEVIFEIVMSSMMVDRWAKSVLYCEWSNTHPKTCFVVNQDHLEVFCKWSFNIDLSTTIIEYQIHTELCIQTILHKSEF